jgi:phospholipid/cholesterol/gamma-HCH transport system ATP-binding protein
MSAPSAPAEAPSLHTEAHDKDVIVFDDVHIAFDENVVLNGISFRLPRGETKAIFGVAGSGKSTLLKMAIGLLKPDSGKIYTLGQDIAEMREQDLFNLRRNVGIVFQESALFDSLTVHDNVAFRLMEEGETPMEEIDRRVLEVLRFVELENTVSMYPSELSGGMRRRVAIARAIINEPQTILYDSPTGGLDPVTSNTIIELIVKQRDVYKTSALLVTHRLQDAFTMASHCFDKKTNRMVPLPPGARTEVPITFMILRDGKIIFDGDLHELAHSTDEYIREYIS